MNTQVETEVQDKVNEVVNQASTDAEFRGRFIEDPREIFANAGVEVPESVEIKVVESTPERVVIPLPEYVGEKLDLEDLENVAGGLDPVTGVVILGVGGLVVGGVLGVGSLGVGGYLGGLALTKK